ncbi:MAG: hypothetical protein GF411_06370 [Candidatus Lokiarchaeota archaeon]|nr:hypothetical protein [Candidatus Lokiarchaeota archaeon]
MNYEAAIVVLFIFGVLLIGVVIFLVFQLANYKEQLNELRKLVWNLSASVAQKNQVKNKDDQLDSTIKEQMDKMEHALAEAGHYLGCACASIDHFLTNDNESSND